MLQTDYAFFNVESMHEFNSTFEAICSDTPHPFEFKFRSKHTPVYTLNFLVITLRNQDTKVALIWVDVYGALERYS